MTITQLRYAIVVANSNSMGEAARTLFISQPSLSASIKELEKEIGIKLFIRSNRGISVTPEGKEFIGYARQVVEQFQLIEIRYVDNEHVKKKIGISLQHYAFAVKAFVEMVKQFGMSEYEFAIHETQTYEVIEDVASLRSEIGILYLNEFNRQVLTKIFLEKGIEYKELLKCGIYVYMYKEHPLVKDLSEEELKKKVITLEELEEYPCLAFDQGSYNSFYFAEEVLSTYDYKQLIRVSDRATMLNLMVGLNGYTLCSGILCETLNGSNYCAVKLDSKELMSIVYIVRKGIEISPLGKKYLEEIRKFQNSGLK
ncbi:LysR family transcriptional regulator [Kandleria sp.]|uniref:LysR family transcriptional regulator n=1 Tax=Kandleria sp. TaxID=2774291 RepID=UPI001B531A56|nr:LysR family transcriptional regulator [Kandleria sp.]MBP3275948.1 LysR family transcriptional regulator [Kandleria sp.]